MTLFFISTIVSQNWLQTNIDLIVQLGYLFKRVFYAFIIAVIKRIWCYYPFVTWLSLVRWSLCYFALVILLLWQSLFSVIVEFQLPCYRTIYLLRLLIARLKRTESVSFWSVVLPLRSLLVLTLRWIHILLILNAFVIGSTQSVQLLFQHLRLFNQRLPPVFRNISILSHC